MNDLDPILKSYFRHEMPKRWPTAPGEASAPAGAASTLISSRLIVGISLAGLLAAYLGLAAFFPRPTPQTVNPNGDPLIGQRPGVDAKTQR